MHTGMSLRKLSSCAGVGIQVAGNISMATLTGRCDCRKVNAAVILIFRNEYT